MCEQLDVELLGEGGQVRRHHAAGGQVHLVTAGLHLVQDKRTSSAFGCWPTRGVTLIYLSSNSWTGSLICRSSSRKRWYIYVAVLQCKSLWQPLSCCWAWADVWDQPFRCTLTHIQIHTIAVHVSLGPFQENMLHWSLRFWEKLRGNFSAKHSTALFFFFLFSLLSPHKWIVLKEPLAGVKHSRQPSCRAVPAGLCPGQRCR